MFKSVKNFVKNVINGGTESSNRRSLRLESLEERQMLAVTTGSFDLGSAAVLAAGYNDYDVVVEASADTAGQNDVVLNGINADGSFNELGRVADVDNNTQLTILGAANKVDNINLDGTAMVGLGEIIINGESNDTVIIEGGVATGNDIFTVDVDSVRSNTPVFTANPYAGLMAYYDSVLGVGNAVTASLGNAWARLSTVVIANTNDVNTVQLSENVAGVVTDFAEVRMSGIDFVSIDGQAGNDEFVMNRLGINYNLTGNNGADTLSFANAFRASVDMNVTGAQHAIIGDVGTITLNNDIETVIGTVRTDRIVADADANSTINGNGGSDVILLNSNFGIFTTVNLSGAAQSVIISGDGNYTINSATPIDRSVINARAASARSTVNVAVTGDFIFYYGGAGTDNVTVTGSYATIFGGAGNDTLIAFGTNLIPSTGNKIYGEAGDDIILAPTATGFNYLFAGAGNDIVVGGVDTDFIYGMTGNNILIGNTGADYIYGGTGDDILIANVTTATTPANLRAAQTAWLAGNARLAETTLGGPLSSVADGDRDIISRGAGRTNMGFFNSGDNDIAVLYNIAGVFNDIIDRNV